MKNLSIGLLVLILGGMFQSCSVESDTLKTPHSGWYEDPMNPKYVIKKYINHKPSPSAAKNANLIKE